MSKIHRSVHQMCRSYRILRKENLCNRIAPRSAGILILRKIWLPQSNTSIPKKLRWKIYLPTNFVRGSKTGGRHCHPHQYFCERQSKAWNAFLHCSHLSNAIQKMKHYHLYGILETLWNSIPTRDTVSNTSADQNRLCWKLCDYSSDGLKCTWNTKN